MLKKDTIAAIATAMSNSGIGIVRISGEDALNALPVNRQKQDAIGLTRTNTTTAGAMVAKAA